MKQDQKTYSRDCDGLIGHVEDVFSEAESRAIIALIKLRKKRRQIRDDYECRREEGERAKDAIRSIAQEHFFSEATIRDMVYRQEKDYFNRRA